MNPSTFQICEKLLKKGGKILLSTQADRVAVEKFVSDNKSIIPNSFSFEIIDIPNNFEKTLIILTKN